MSGRKNTRDLIACNASRAVESSIIGRDVLLRTAHRFLGLSPWKLAAGSLVAGFGILSVFYAALAVFGSPLMRLRGLYSYYSATLGDGILLPLGVAVSAAAIRDMEELLEHSLKSKDTELKRRVHALGLRLGSPALVWIPGALALIVTAGVHVAWLLDPRTEPNWTIVPGHLNFFGYWHAAFFLVVLWWYLAFLGRLVLITQGLWGYSGSQSLAPALLRIWGELNVLLAAVAGFASLLYVDNYGFRFSWQILLSSITTLTNILFTAIVLLAVNLYFTFAVYRPASLKTSGQERKQMRLLAGRSWAAFSFGCLLVGSLVLLAAALSICRAWPMAAVIAGLLLPILFAENYAADLYWNHNRAPDPVESLAVCLILIISSGGLLTALALALQGSHVKTIVQMVPSWGASAGVSIVTSLICIAVAWVASWTMLEKPRDGQWYMTDESPLHNMLQNFLQLWGLFQFLVIPAAVFVYHEKMALSPDGKLTVLGTISGAVIAIVGIPLYNNYSHLRDLRNRPSKPQSIDRISHHILFITMYVGAITILVLGWLWTSSLDEILNSK